MNTPEKKKIDIESIEKFFRIDEDGAVWSYRRQRYLKPTFNTSGYLFVAIPIYPEQIREGYKWAYNYAVHRLVAVKYIGQCPYGLETSHKDGNKCNNHYTNLEYITHSENLRKSFREHGRPSPTWLVNRNPFSDETKEKMSNAKKKPVEITYPSGEVIPYPSIGDAAQSLNIDRKSIYRSIKNNTPITSKGIFIGKASFQITYN